MINTEWTATRGREDERLGILNRGDEMMLLLCRRKVRGTSYLVTTEDAGNNEPANNLKGIRTMEAYL